MIKVTTGDIFESPAKALVNPVNTVGVMGKGLALAFKKRYPHNFKCYQQACEKGKFDVGQMLIVEDVDQLGPRTIVNFPTKRDWKNLSTYEYIRSGLDNLGGWLTLKEVDSIAIPAIGCGLGGLEWINVRELVEDALQHCGQTIYLYKPT